jgi:hypothetical protein
MYYSVVIKLTYVILLQMYKVNKQWYASLTYVYFNVNNDISALDIKHNLRCIKLNTK